MTQAEINFYDDYTKELRLKNYQPNAIMAMIVTKMRSDGINENDINSYMQSRFGNNMVTETIITEEYIDDVDDYIVPGIIEEIIEEELDNDLYGDDYGF